MWRSFSCVTLHHRVTSSVANDTLPWLWLLFIVMLQRRLCDCYVSRGLYRSMRTETQCRRRRTRGNGLGRQRAICMNGVARNKNILPMVALDEYISWWWLATEHGLSSFESTILPRILISQTSGSRKILPCYLTSVISKRYSGSAISDLLAWKRAKMPVNL